MKGKIVLSEQLKKLEINYLWTIPNWAENSYPSLNWQVM